MLCSFTIRFRSFIWFLIFTFTLYSIPSFEYLLPYKIHLFFSEAEAAVGEPDESQVPNQGEAPANASEADQPSSKEPPAQPAAAVKPDSSQLSGIPSATFKREA